MKNNLTKDRLKQLLEYSERSGLFVRKETTSSNAITGAVAGTTDALGYVTIRVDGVSHKAHRLAWLYVYGAFPEKHLDHINGNPSDNKISNLRECTAAENQQNQKRRSDCKSGYTGVSFHKASGKWQASIRVNGRTIHLGIFDDPQEAHAEYVAAKTRLHTFNPSVRQGAE